MESLRFLLVTWDGGGVIPPELCLARKLIARGHTVHVLADPTVEPEARAAGCTFGPWTTAPHRTSRDRSADLLRDYAYTNKMRYFDDMTREFLAGPALRWVADVEREVAKHPCDVMLVDSVIPSALIAAEKLRVPCAILSTMIYTVPTRGIPPMGMGLMPAKGPLGRVRDALLRKLFARFYDKALPGLNAARKAHGLSTMRTGLEQMTRADHTLVLTSPVFDFTSPYVPKDVSWVGAQLDDPSWSEPWCSPWSPDDERPLVLVGLSSTFQDQVPLLRRCVQALSGLPVRALVTLGPSVRPDEVSGAGNVVVVRSAPHGEVLPEASLLVTHCGHGTTIKGLAAGVPMVCLPMGRDQNDNAARVVYRGAGVRLKPSASEASIRAAVRSVLDEPGYRAAARKLATAITANEGCTDPVTLLESLARSRRGEGTPCHFAASSATSSQAPGKMPITITRNAAIPRAAAT